MSEGSILFSLNAHLLQFFVDKVDTDLFKGIEFKNLKAGDVQHANEGDLLHCWVAGNKKSKKKQKYLTMFDTDNSKYSKNLTCLHKSVVAHVYDVTEETPVDVLDD